MQGMMQGAGDDSSFWMGGGRINMAMMSGFEITRMLLTTGQAYLGQRCAMRHNLNGINMGWGVGGCKVFNQTICSNLDFVRIRTDSKSERFCANLHTHPPFLCHSQQPTALIAGHCID